MRTAIALAIAPAVLAPTATGQERIYHQPLRPHRPFHGATTPRPPEKAVGYTDLLEAMVDLDRLYRPAPSGERCFQFSSYDRRSDKGPGKAADWYANDDWGNFLRSERRNGRQENVMVDTPGPGSVVRIWAASPRGTLRFYVDGATQATWTIPFQKLCNGKTAPMLEPIAGERAFGWNCYLPIPFRKRMVVTCDQGGFYYHVNVRAFAPGTRVDTFSPAFLTTYGQEIAAVRHRLQVGPDIRARRNRDNPRRILRSGESALLFDSAGPAVVRQLALRVTREPFSDLPRRDVMRSLRLRVVHEDEELVNVPLADFFASAPELRPHVGYPIRVGHDRWLSCRFPMPLPGRSRITLHADRTTPTTSYSVALESRVAFDMTRLAQDTLLFRASWHQKKGILTRPFSDHRVLAADGRGRFVGCALQVTNPSRLWWGEGDEKFWVDGERFPSTFGTGTEDYFGYGWGRIETFSHAYHAQTQVDGPIAFGNTSLYRFHLPDAVPFQRSFLFELEVWHKSHLQQAVDYATTAFWYGAPGARSGLPAPPPAGERLPRKLMPLPTKKVEGAIEGETLPRVASRGNAWIQDTRFYEGRWSYDMHVWWTGAKPSDTLALQVPVSKSGRYRVKLRFTRSKDYAIFAVLMDRTTISPFVDLYAPHTVPTPEIDFGIVDLQSGIHQLTFLLLGRNMKASGDYGFGLDYVRLVPVP